MTQDPIFRSAQALDAADPLTPLRERFHIPRHGDAEQHYFCGNSLGLMPKAARRAIEDELDDWARLAVEAHFAGKHPWMPYHETLREPLARLVGAEPGEVVAMNSLTVNLHLMMVSFYRPTAERPAILIEAGAFPSDRHAVESQIRFHGFNPATDLIEIAPDQGSGTISMQTFERVFEAEGARIALALLPGVQYRSGQAFDIGTLTRMAHRQGCVIGFDLAHAAGNLVLNLHDDGPDFAAWCHYKYCNAGPGAVAGCFVHARHARSERPRFAGWWGHDPSTRFRMGPEFSPTPGADGWQLSNPPILALAPLRASLELFSEVGMPNLRARAERLTGFLQSCIEDRLLDLLEILTPLDPTQRGCQLSLRVRGGRERGRALFQYLADHGVLGDWREPDVIRISPVPLYNSFHDIAAFVHHTAAWRLQA